MKKIMALAALLAIFTAVAQAESGFKFFASSATLNAPLVSTGTLTLSDAGLVISTTTGTKGITFQDGSLLSSALAVATPINVALKSTSTIITVLTTNTNPSICLSTLTITTSYNSRLHISVNATMEATTSVDHGFSFLIDGVPGMPIGPSDGMFDTKTPNNNEEFGYSYSYLSNVLSDGPHNICLAVWTLSGTFKTSDGHYLQWYAHEIK